MHVCTGKKAVRVRVWRCFLFLAGFPLRFVVLFHDLWLGKNSLVIVAGSEGQHHIPEDTHASFMLATNTNRSALRFRETFTP